MFKINNLSVDLADTSVLRNINVEFPKASTIGVVGHNGAGKTTLLRTIMGLTTIKNGDVSLDGNLLSEKEAHQRAFLKIGYAPENRVIFPTLSVEENLRLPCEIQDYSRAETNSKLEEVLEVIPQLKPLLERSGSALSGGQGKMVALGRAVMIGERLLLLDEPFQGLAPKLGFEYTEALSRLKQIRADLTVVITESNIKLLSGIPDQYWQIERGNITKLQEKYI
ncbi:ABC transporter ATP-binding protein [Oligella sp. HMSC05A10]|uniref:ABC transporter ATP-binding protein n=1 Tax=Oligella sp. HMSC05A10 TaxID=1581112 RepID=UPI0008A161BE|nr:ATP-binding cassette domain-containing protein [Oligella sp. HMSC05A10]OFS85627.1 ABC transporter ATP-binding protein [Oligella sp. HMSC05A10]